MEFVQINPEFEPMYILPGRVESTLHFQPLPIGAKLHLARWSKQIGNTILVHSGGIQKSNTSIDITVKNPGLNYFGSYRLNTETTFWTIGDSKFVIDESKTELDALLMLKKHFKKTEWENLIDDRIKELQK
jgi:hypothetical protein